MDFTKELKTVDFQELFDKLASYAASRLDALDIRVMDGKEPADMVSDLFVKVLTGQRNADIATCSLTEFLFGCLKSDIDAFFRKKKFNWLSLADGVQDTSIASVADVFAVTEIKSRLQNELQKIGADEIEIEVFSLWTEGIIKPEKVGLELGLSPSEIYKIQRRLQNRLKKIHQNFQALV